MTSESEKHVDAIIAEARAIWVKANGRETPEIAIMAVLLLLADAVDNLEIAVRS